MKFGAKRKIKKAADNVTKARNNLAEEKMSPASDMVISDRRSSSGPIGQKEITEAVGILLKYKEGKVNLENRIIENEQWWKRRHWDKLRKNEEIAPASAWLFNCIMSKYADYMDAYPEPNILPREEGDKQEAKILTSIVPVVLEQNGFYKVYSNKSWKILKDGSAIYGIFWDGQNLMD